MRSEHNESVGILTCSAVSIPKIKTETEFKMETEKPYQQKIKHKTKTKRTKTKKTIAHWTQMI